MDIGRLKRRIDNLRQPIIRWLDFYRIPNLEDKTDQELTTILINKITNYREYGYTQNREFEELLQSTITNENEERNKINWNIIVDIYKIHMKETIERLGKTFEDLGYRQQWQALSNQAIIIATKTLQIRAILKQSIQKQKNKIQQTKDAIIPKLNQISPITEINGLNEASIIEINQVAQDLLLE